MLDFFRRFFGGNRTLDLETGKYDPAPGTDKARRRIGYTLLALLFVIVLLGFATLYLTEFRAYSIDQNLIAGIKTKADIDRVAAILNFTTTESKASADRLAALLNIVFGPVVTLLGSVTGFYFGTHSVQNPAVPTETSPLNLDQQDTGAPSGDTPVGDAAGSSAHGVGSG